MQRFEQALAGAMDGATIRDGKKGGATPAANADGTQAMKGEQHVS